ncbi:hypothetical protein D3C85_1486920 [compost metagenome]
MRDIGEKLELMLVNFFFLFKYGLNQQIADKYKRYGNKGCQIKQISPPGAIKWWQYRNVEGAYCVGPHTIIVGTFNHQRVIARRKVGIGCRRNIYVIPVFFEVT